MTYKKKSILKHLVKGYQENSLDLKSFYLYEETTYNQHVSFLILVTSFVQITIKFHRHMNNTMNIYFADFLVASRWPRIAVALTVFDSYLNRRDFQ